MRKIIYIAALLILFAGNTGCKDVYTICGLSKDVNFSAGFYQHVGAVDVRIQAPALSVNLIGNPTTIYNNQPNASSFLLTLNALTDSAKYSIKMSASLPPDTLTIVYSSRTVALSAECGSIYNHTVTALRSTNHTIDSVKITASSISNTQIENARIYF